MKVKKIQIKNKKRFAIICGVIVLIIVAIVVLICGNNRQIKTATNEIDMTNTENVVIENGKKVNNSDEMKNKKNTGDLTFEALDLFATDTQSKFIIRAKNESDIDFEGKEVKIFFYNKEGNVYGEVESYIGKIASGKTTKVEVTTTLDITNAYDYKIELYDANI